MLYLHIGKVDEDASNGSGDGLIIVVAVLLVPLVMKIICIVLLVILIVNLKIIAKMERK